MITSFLISFALQGHSFSRKPPGGMEWPNYGLQAGGMRYVANCRIDAGNVARLKEVWTFHTGDLSDGKNKPFSAFECTPLFVDGTLYVVSPFNRVFALDPDTGKEIWKFDPHIDKFHPKATEAFACRGIATWKNPKTGKQLLYLATYDGRLIALDAKTGQPVSGFGNAGSIDLRSGVGARYLNQYIETSPPCVVNNLVVVGSSIADNVAVDMPSGKVRSYDTQTGRLMWSWEPIGSMPPAPTPTDPIDLAYAKSAPDGVLRTGAANAWAPLSADPKRDMLFVPTTSPSPDFSGATRPGDDKDADSIVALRASTGKKIWSFQVVHHDLWDYDIPAQPILATVCGTPVVVIMTKMGFIFVLDRLTGKSIFPVIERKVPTDGLPGEPVSPTQPFPVLPKPIVPDRFEAWTLTDAGHRMLQRKLAGVRQDGIFTPPTINGTLIFPGDIGGCNWSGGCFSPRTDTLFVNANILATVVFMIPRVLFGWAESAFPGLEMGPEFGAPYGMRREWLFAPGLIPASKPPWGTLSAIYLRTGKLRWQVPLGQLPQFSDVPMAKQWGCPNLGGSFVTSTGLVFISATTDARIRAFDARTGKVVWSHALPAGGQATPMTFISPRSGREYVVQCAGGHHGLGDKEGDSVVAFAVSR